MNALNVQRDSGRDEAIRALRWLQSPIPGLPRRLRFYRPGLISIVFFFFTVCFLALYVTALITLRLAVVLLALVAWGVLSGVGVIQRRK